MYEAVWGVRLDGANFRRRVVAEDGWVVPTGRRARPGAVRRQARRAVPGRSPPGSHGGPLRRPGRPRPSSEPPSSEKET